MRFKLLSIYLVIILVLFLIILGWFPSVFRTYLLQRSQEDLLTTKQIIQETLEQTVQTDFQTSVHLRDKLDAVAQAKGIEIWICKEPETLADGSQVIPVIRLGSRRSECTGFSAFSGERPVYRDAPVPAGDSRKCLKISFQSITAKKR